MYKKNRNNFLDNKKDIASVGVVGVVILVIAILGVNVLFGATSVFAQEKDEKSNVVNNNILFTIDHDQKVEFNTTLKSSEKLTKTEQGYEISDGENYKLEIFFDDISHYNLSDQKSLGNNDFLGEYSRVFNGSEWYYVPNSAIKEGKESCYIVDSCFANVFSKYSTEKAYEVDYSTFTETQLKNADKDKINSLIPFKYNYLFNIRLTANNDMGFQRADEIVKSLKSVSTEKPFSTVVHKK